MSAQAVKAALAQANSQDEPPCPKQKLHRKSTTQANADNLIQMIFGHLPAYPTVKDKNRVRLDAIDVELLKLPWFLRNKEGKSKVDRVLATLCYEINKLSVENRNRRQTKDWRDMADCEAQAGLGLIHIMYDRRLWMTLSLGSRRQAIVLLDKAMADYFLPEYDYITFLIHKRKLELAAFAKSETLGKRSDKYVRKGMTESTSDGIYLPLTMVQQFEAELTEYYLELANGLRKAAGLQAHEQD